MSLPNPTPPTLSQVRFSNANTTTDRYRFGAGPDLPHTLPDAPGAVDDVACVPVDDVVDIVDDGATREVGRADELHPAAIMPARASIVTHRRSETTFASSGLGVMSQACPANAPLSCQHARWARPGVTI
jgi:hypothetical protein